MRKISLPLACGVFLAVGCIAAAVARAESIPQATATRIINLAPPSAEEKTPVISSVAIDQAGRFLAAVGDDHLVRIFDAQSGQIMHRWSSHTDWVKASMFQPDGQLLATAGADRRICLWTTTPGGQSHELSESPQVIFALVYSPDGRTVAAAGFDDKVWMYDAETGQLLRELVGPGSDIRAISFSPDGSKIAAAGRTGSVCIWEAKSGRQVANVQVSSRRICALAHSPDGKLMAAAGQRRIVRLLDASTGKPLADLPERPGEVLSLCFCGPDTLASAGSGNVIHLWDLTTRQEKCSLVGHIGSITTLVYYAQTETLISGSYDTTVRLWDAKSQDREKLTQTQDAKQVTRRTGPARAD